MNYQQLAAYIRELQRSGIDTITLQVSFYRKFALPLFALVMALISVPFAFLAGNRGAMAGVGVSFTIAIAYWTIGKLFEQLGDVNLAAGHAGGLVAGRDLRHGRAVFLHPHARPNAPRNYYRVCFAVPIGVPIMSPETTISTRRFF